MKFSHRPPLNLSDPEPGEDQDETIPSITEEALELAPELQPEPQPQSERPMSERRRRRLMEEQRLAEQ
ncbi:hypothetical protein, partial [Brevundimonas sp. M-11_2]